MTFKRYGGRFTSNDENGDQRVGILGIFVLVGFVFAAPLLGEPYLVVVGFLLFFTFTCVSLMYRGGAQSGIRRKRYEMHVRAAIDAYQVGDIAAAKEAIRKAKIYRELPADLQQIEQSIASSSNN